MEFLLGFQDDLVRELQGALVIQQIAQSYPTQLVEVLVAEEHVAARKLAVSASSTDLLDVVLERARYVVVDDRLDVTLVNSHAERDGAAQDPRSVGYEVGLDLGSLVIGLASVIRACFEAVLVQDRG